MTSTRSRHVLLMICYKFPPMHSVSCKRTWALHQEFSKHFTEVHVISTSNRHVLPQSNIDTGDAHVIDARTRDYRTMLQGGKGKHASASESAKQSWLGKAAMKLQASFPTLYWLGEGGRTYIRSAVSHARKVIQSTGVTHLFSTFPPYADHLIAYRLKQEFPKLIWIADFRDLHVDPTQDNLMFRNYQMRRNREILQSADLVATVSKGLAEHLSLLHSKVHVLYNGINEVRKPKQLFAKFTIAYSGSMFQDKRRPDRLLEVIADCMRDGTINPDEVALVYAGKDGDVWRHKTRQYSLTTLFEERGLISSKEAQDLQRKSHLNLLLTYSAPDLKGNLTGKLFDYLEAGRPIIVLINGPPDQEISSLIEDANAGFVCADDTAQSALRDFVVAQYKQWQETGTLEARFNTQSLNRLRWPVQVGDFVRSIGISQVQHARS